MKGKKYLGYYNKLVNFHNHLFFSDTPYDICPIPDDNLHKEKKTATHSAPPSTRKQKPMQFMNQVIESIV